MNHRNLKVGDVVLYDISGQRYNIYGDIDYTIKPYTRTGIMLIASFDYDNDRAARCSVGRSAIGLKGILDSNYAPGATRYRKAKKHHIKKFIRELCANELTRRVYSKEIKYLQTLI